MLPLLTHLIGHKVGLRIRTPSDPGFFLPDPDPLVFFEPDLVFSEPIQHFPNHIFAS
jgi:hypothetical protein